MAKHKHTNTIQILNFHRPQKKKKKQQGWQEKKKKFPGINKCYSWVHFGLYYVINNCSFDVSFLPMLVINNNSQRYLCPNPWNL